MFMTFLFGSWQLPKIAVYSQIKNIRVLNPRPYVVCLVDHISNISDKNFVAFKSNKIGEEVLTLVSVAETLWKKKVFRVGPHQKVFPFGFLSLFCLESLLRRQNPISNNGRCFGSNGLEKIL